MDFTLNHDSDPNLAEAERLRRQRRQRLEEREAHRELLSISRVAIFIQAHIRRRIAVRELHSKLRQDLDAALLVDGNFLIEEERQIDKYDPPASLGPDELYCMVRWLLFFFDNDQKQDLARLCCLCRCILQGIAQEQSSSSYISLFFHDVHRSGWEKQVERLLSLILSRLAKVVDPDIDG